MLSLTDTPEPNLGGFECVKGFHREFEAYFAGAVERSAQGLQKDVVCVGDFCPIRTKEDAALIARYEHVAVPAGAAVFWDQRVRNVRLGTHASELPVRMCI